MDEDTTDAAEFQQQLEERRRIEDELFERCAKLTKEKKLTDEEFRVEFSRFLRTLKKPTERI